MRLTKCTSLFLSFLLLVSNMGLAFNVHFCEGQIASITSVFNVEEVCEVQPVPALEEKACCAEAAKDHKSCCDDKIVDLKDKDHDVVIKFTFGGDFLFHVAPITEIPSFIPKAVFPVKKDAVYHFEPENPPLFKLYHQYIFYA
ncbi:MAG TPA: hypothetical protein VGB50_04295 [Flavobacterium sp.]|jgi:hypothetical protein